MSDLFQRLKRAVADGRYVTGKHAALRLDERRISEWQVIAGLSEGRLLRERPDAQPNSVVEVEQHLADGTPVKAVWAWLSYHQAAKLVTVHYLDREDDHEA